MDGIIKDIHGRTYTIEADDGSIAHVDVDDLAPDPDDFGQIAAHAAWVSLPQKIRDKYRVMVRLLPIEDQL